MLFFTLETLGYLFVAEGFIEKSCHGLDTDCCPFCSMTSPLRLSVPLSQLSNRGKQLSKTQSSSDVDLICAQSCVCPQELGDLDRYKEELHSEKLCCLLKAAGKWWGRTQQVKEAYKIIVAIVTLNKML